MRVDNLIRRHFWMVTVVVVVTCSGLAASAAAHIIAATLLAEPSAPLPRPVARWRPPVAAVQPGTALADRSRLLVQRNIFCSACEPPTPAVAAAASPSDEPPLTALPLRLIATRIGPAGTRPRATIRNTQTAHQGAVRLGDAIPGAGEVKRIAGSYVDFWNGLTSRLERVSLLGPRPSAPRPAPPRLPPSQPEKKKKSPRAELLAKIEAGVRERGEGRYEIDRAVLNEVLAHPLAAARGARVVPAVENGKPRGFKLTRVKRKSVYSMIGLKSGDTIQAVNGFELTSMDKALEVYTRFRAANHVTLSLTRRGKPMTLDYTIR